MALDVFEQLQPHLEKLSRLPKPARMSLVPALVVLVLVGYGYLFYMPVSSQIDGVRDQKLQLQRKLSEVRSVAANEAAVRAEIEVLEKKLVQALRQLPNEKELPVLLTDITSLGKNAGLDFKAFRPQNEVARAFYAEVPIDIEFTGGFHDVAMFFDEVSRLPRIVNIGELEVTIARETSTETTLQVEGQATTFRFVEMKEAPPEKSKGPKRRKGGHGHGGGH